MVISELRNHQCDQEDREAQYDGYGIFLCYTCPMCHGVKMSQWRTDIMDRYECDEPIEPEDY